jgi:fibronectin type 3 domain-containing protein
MRKRFSYLLSMLIIAVSLLWGNTAMALHLMGGDVTYKYIGNNKYALKFLIYRDDNCTGCASMPTSITYYAYTGSNVAKSDYSAFATHAVKLFSIGYVKPVAPNCASPTGVKAQQGIYLDTFTAGNDSLGYHITWFSNGTRNSGAILNLDQGKCPNSPNPFSMSWYTFIPNNSYKNSSPQFLSVPLPYLCVGKTNYIQPNASDPDKDSLVFSLEVPFSPPPTCGIGGTPIPYPLGHPNFQQVSYLKGYSVTDPFGNGSKSISIDPQTGVITATPPKIGSYVIAIQVKEYRYDPVRKKTVFLDFVRRDLQFIVGSGCPSVSPPVFSTLPSSSSLSVAPGDSIAFDVGGYAANGTDSLHLSATGGIFSGPNATVSAPYATYTGPYLNYKGKATGHFVWHPSCQQITYSSPFIVTFNMSDQSCNTVFYTVQITVKPRPIQTPPILKCADIISGSSIKLSFTDSSTKPQFLQYKIYRDTGYSGNYVLVDSVNSFLKTSWTDTKATNNKRTVYSYYITAQNTCGLEGLPSDTVNSIVIVTKKTGDNRVTLTWNSAGYHVKHKYKVYQGSVSSITLVDSTTSNKRTYIFASCSGTYRFQVQLLDSTGSCIAHSGDTVLVSLNDITAPHIDTNLVNVTVLTNNSVRLTISRSDSNDTRYYKVYRSTNGGAFSQIDSIKHIPGQKTYLFSDNHSVDALNNSYCYAIKAVDSCGNVSKYSNTICQSYIRGTAGYLSNKINWYYTFAKHGSKVFQKLIGNTWTNLLINPKDTFYQDNNLLCNQKYQYRIFETDNKNDTSISNTISLTPFDTVHPPQPKIWYATVAANHTVYVTWNKSIPKVKQYIVFRKGPVSAKFIAIDTVKNDTFYTDKKARPDSGSYCYEIQSIDSCNNYVSPPSPAHCTIQLGTLAPGCLQKLFVAFTSYSGWANGVSKYEIYRKTDGGAAALIKTITSGLDTFTDFNVSNKHTYTYFVKAYQTGGNFISFSDSSANGPFKVPTPYIKYASKITTSASSGKIVVKWKSMRTKYIKFSRLFYKPFGSGSFSLLKDNIPPSVDSFVHTGLNTNTKDHEYYMISYDSCGNVSDTSSIHKTMDLNIKVGQLAHFLDWTAYQGWPVKEYYMQMQINGVFTTVDSIDGNQTSKRRFPAPCNSAIYYRILAKSYAGDIAMSDTSGAQAIDTIPSNPPKLVYASVYDYQTNYIVFRGADSADTYGYGIFRSDSNGKFNSIQFVPFTFPGDSFYFPDLVSTTDSRHCYFVVTLDSCLNTTYSDTFCPVFLTGKAQNQANLLKFSPFKGFKIKEYDLETWVNNKWQILSVKKKPGDTSFIHIPLACYVDRYYRVVALENGGLNRVTFSDSIKLTPFDTITPPAPVLKYATAIPGTGYKLEWRWDKSTDVKYFEVWRADSASKPKLIKTIIYDSTYIDKVLPVNNKYKYYVIAIDSCNSNHRSPPSLSQQTNKLYTNNSACKPRIVLRWSGYSGFLRGTKAYSIYRSGGGQTQKLLTTTAPSARSFTDTTAFQNVLYTYQVQSVDSAGKYSSWSDTISAAPFVYPVPVAIQIKRATVLKTAANGAVLVEWNSLDLTDPYASGYRLYTATSSSGTFSLLKDFNDKTITSYVQNNINTLNTSFYYYIAPYNICNKEGIASTIHHTINLQIANTNLSAKLSWNRYSGFVVDHYEIYKAQGGAALVPTFIIRPTDTTYTDTNIYCKRQYTYQVFAVQKGGTVVSASDSLTIAAFDNTPPGQTTLKSASVISTDQKTGQVLINFVTVPDKNLAGYVVYRSINGGLYQASDSFRYTGKGIYQYFDNFLNTASNTYSYYFQTFDSCGNLAVLSDTHTVVHITAQALNNLDRVMWSDYQGFPQQKYIIQRKTGNQAWHNIGTVSTGANVFDDTTVYCHVLYKYRILTENTANNIDSSYSNTDTVRAYKTTPPAGPEIINATVTVTSNTLGQILLNWKPSRTSDIEKYLIFRRNVNTPWQLISTLNSTVFSFTDVNLNTHYWPYYYKIMAVDSCRNISLDINGFHRTVNLVAKPADQIVDLKWNTYWGFKVIRYELYKNGALFKTFDSLTTTYPDSFVMCPIRNNYVIKAVGIDTISWSNRDSAAPVDTTPPRAPVMKTVTVSIPNNTVDVVWRPSTSGDALGYKIYRTIGNSENKFIYQNNAPDSVYSDTLTLKGDPVCYEIVAFDHCGNTSLPSNSGCIINLKGNVKGGEHDLDWNKYLSWKDSVDYYNIYRKEDSASWVLIGRVTTSQLKYVDKDLAAFVKNFCYRVEAVEKKGGLNAQSWSTVVCLNQPPVVWVPNGFTPDYSFNLNDNFGPAGTYFSDYDMRIYDRWGEKIYETHSGKPWDGKFHGTQVVDGVYLYQIDVHGYDGVIYTFKGNISIVK